MDSIMLRTKDRFFKCKLPIRSDVDGASQLMVTLKCPDWDPGVALNRGGGAHHMYTPNLSARMLGAAPMSQGGGASSGFSNKGQSHSGHPQIRSRVVVARYRRLSIKTLFSFSKPFGTLRDHLVLSNKAFLEMDTHHEALEMVIYYRQHPANMCGKTIAFYLSKELIVIEKDEWSGDRANRNVKGRCHDRGSKVVFFSNLPREDVKKIDVLTVAGRFGIVEKHLFLNMEAFVQLGTPQDAAMMVNYYRRNPLTIWGKPVHLNICTKYKTLNVNTPNLSPGLLGAAPKSQGLSAGGVPSSWGGGASSGFSSKGQSHSGHPQKCSWLALRAVLLLRQRGASRVVYIGQLPNTKYTDEHVLKLAEPFGKVKKYFLNRIRRECFIEMENAEDTQKMSESCKASPPKLQGKRLSVYISRKYKQLKYGHRRPIQLREKTPVKRAGSSASSVKSSKPTEEPPAKKAREETAPAEERVEKTGAAEPAESNPSMEPLPQGSEGPGERPDSQKTAADLKSEEVEVAVSPSHNTSRADNVTVEQRMPADPKLALAPCDPDNPIGVEYVKLVYCCQVCFLFYSNEDIAKKVHCSSQAHYDKVKEHLEKELAKATRKRWKTE